MALGINLNQSREIGKDIGYALVSPIGEQVSPALCRKCNIRLYFSFSPLLLGLIGLLAYRHMSKRG